MEQTEEVDKLKTECENLKLEIEKLGGKLPRFLPWIDLKTQKSWLEDDLVGLRTDIRQEEERRSRLTPEQRKEEDDCFNFLHSEKYKCVIDTMDFLDDEHDECFVYPPPRDKEYARKAFILMRDAVTELEEKCKMAHEIIKNYNKN